MLAHISETRFRSLQQTGLMALVTIAVAGVTLVILYQAAYQSQQNRLTEMAKTQSAIIAGLTSQYQLKNPLQPGNHIPDSVIQLIRTTRQQDQAADGSRAVLIIGRLNKRLTHIEIVLDQDAQKDGKTMLVNLNSTLAQPMQRALAGQSGIMTGSDHQGTDVLAAYEPVKNLQLGVVVKINLAEFKIPFIRAGIIAAIVGSLVILIGSLLFRRLGTTMVQAAEENELQLGVILDTVVDGIVTVDTHGIIKSCNKAAEKIFGYTAKEATGKNINLFIPESSHEQHKEYVSNYTSDKSVRILGLNREVTGQRKDGSSFPMDLAVSIASVGEDKIFTSIVRDITQRKIIEEELEQHRKHLEDEVEQRTRALHKANEKLEQLARIDSLTGIANRRVFDKVLSREVSRASRDQLPIAFFLCDIDYFKNYNDSLGHLVGDECLKKVAGAISQKFNRSSDLVARFGGEEFAIILPNTNKQNGEKLANDLLEVIRKLNIPHPTSSVSDRITISIGVISVIPRNSLSKETLIKAADDALYLAKEQGRDRLVVSVACSDDHPATRTGGN